MDRKLIQFKEAVQYRTLYYKQRIAWHLRRFWLRAVILAILAFLIHQKDLSIDLQLNAIAESFLPEFYGEIHPAGHKLSAEPVPGPMNTSMLQPASTPASAPAPKPVRKVAQKTSGDPNMGNTYSNMTYTGKDFATKDSRSAAEIKKQKQLAYVRRFSKVAQTEMEKFGIPASITLAQGLLESNAGESKLAVHNNNHFGIKCFSRTCKKGHCSNFTDDTHKDFFRKYQSAWESYRGHSYLLRADRYQHLYKLSAKDYQGWAKGLKKAGYATDKYYAEKLINLINDLDLHRYDL